MLTFSEVTMTTLDADVIVVGAGPTGLLLAGDLAAAGVRCTVLERRRDEQNTTRAFAVHARTLEELDARGLADELIATGSPVRQLRLFDRVHVDIGRLPTRFPYLLVTPQYNTERILLARAQKHGATIVSGAEVVGLDQDLDGDLGGDLDGVTVRTGVSELRARYVVGADGIRSVVRQAVGLPFPGGSVVRSIMLADVRLAEHPDDVLPVNAVADGFAFIAPFGDGWFRVFAWNPHNPLPDTAPVDFDEVRTVARHAFGTDYGMHDPRWLSRFHSDERQAPHYRVGNVFIAGDAAHCQTPAGGQGMNTGLQDAANLGWKLAAAVHGWAPDGLLDTYEAERFPVGRSVLRMSGALIRLGMISSALGRAVRRSVGASAMQVPPVARRAADAISGLGIRYRYPAGVGYRGGERAEDIRLSDGRLYEARRDGRFVLVAPSHVDVGGWTDRVRSVVRAEPIVASGAPDTVTLIRPDGYVAWTGDIHDATALDVALAALRGPAVMR
jgi:2-polyprenyl-6-methoxyphenol hydroxylase-like FAD-dependent oxidoreductase